MKLLNRARIACVGRRRIAVGVETGHVALEVTLEYEQGLQQHLAQLLLTPVEANGLKRAIGEAVKVAKQ